MRVNIFKKYAFFFDIFDQLAAAAMEASSYFCAVASKWIYTGEVAGRMQETSGVNTDIVECAGVIESIIVKWA